MPKPTPLPWLLACFLLALTPVAALSAQAVKFKVAFEPQPFRR